MPMFGLINGPTPFFLPVEEGWIHKCNELGVTCHVRSSEWNETCGCDCVLETYITEYRSMRVDGMSIKPCTTSATIIDETIRAGIPVVTFDGDVPSNRSAYVGTDNRFMGRTMARLLRQLKPKGGTFAIIAAKEHRTEGFIEEITKYNGITDGSRPHWHSIGEIDGAYFSEEEYMSQMEQVVLQNPTAMVILRQTPMRHPNWMTFIDANRHRGIIYLGTDGSDYQLAYLKRRYVDGLIGQMPFEWGLESLQVLHDLVTKGNDSIESKIIPTNILSYSLIPLELPPQEVDQNLLGDLKFVGFICFGLVACTAIGCIAWTLRFRKSVVVRAAQPFFLVMVSTGIIILSSSLIPLSFDDGGSPDSMPRPFAIGICMSVPWLAFTGFTITFSALFSKTWRVNRLFHARVPHARFQVTERDVLTPFVILLMSNVVVLVCWTIKAFDPLVYIRQEHDGTDYWNRVISTYGACRSNNALAYLIPLTVINLGVVVTACWQAVQAMDIESEFSESKYIGLAVALICQGFLTGIPIVVLVRDLPRVFYVVLSIIIFVLCMVVQLLIFLPKIIMQLRYASMTEREQEQMFTEIIRGRCSSRSRERSEEFSMGRQADSAREEFSVATPYCNRNRHENKEGGSKRSACGDLIMGDQSSSVGSSAQNQDECTRGGGGNKQKHSHGRRIRR